ncbi:MAG: hypothetical protein R2795_14515 [Saprospiraceae bacterium]
MGTALLLVVGYYFLQLRSAVDVGHLRWWTVVLPLLCYPLAWWWLDTPSPEKEATWFYFHPWSGAYLRFTLLSFLGLLPFLGFTVAGFRDLVYKWKKGEEQARLLAVALLAGWLMQSLLFSFVLIFLSARQLDHYFKQGGYPWRDWVKTVQVLHLVSVFMAAILVLIGGYVTFQAEGYRAVLGATAGYWMFSFLAVIGLYGVRRDYVLGGITLAGVLTMLFFWVQVYPYIELQRNWPQRLLTALPAPPAAIGYDFKDPACQPLPLYLHREGYLFPVDTMPDFFIQQLPLEDTTGVYPVDVRGRSGLLRTGRWGSGGMGEM